MRTKMLRSLLLVAVALLWVALLTSEVSATQAGALWTDVRESSLGNGGTRQVVPSRYRLVAADVAALRALLTSAPLERTAEARSNPVVLPLPLPDGSTGRFQIVEYAMMEPALAAKFPELRTYLGQGLDNPAATVRLDFTSQGFHAQILAPGGAFYIDPYRQGDIQHYISYDKRDLAKQRLPELGVLGADLDAELAQVAGSAASGDTLRTYQLAVAATGEYTEFHGGRSLLHKRRL